MSPEMVNLDFGLISSRSHKMLKGANDLTQIEAKLSIAVLLEYTRMGFEARECAQPGIENG